MFRSLILLATLSYLFAFVKAQGEVTTTVAGIGYVVSTDADGDVIETIETLPAGTGDETSAAEDEDADTTTTAAADATSSAEDSEDVIQAPPSSSMCTTAGCPPPPLTYQNEDGEVATHIPSTPATVEPSAVPEGSMVDATAFASSLASQAADATPTNDDSAADHLSVFGKDTMITYLAVSVVAVVGAAVVLV